ncbi:MULTISPECIES: hypothetical protein [Nioella]|jgi:hypothetical protein|uniref:hypothetical protein n=1 Tax=Nioella TaxID=1775424 RepID=UPI0008FD12C9|nr:MULTISPECIES: hypothetical protein [Nioella]TBX27763.1 hypothetical protein TK43_09250 [Roseovarius sp. JS7-11]
MNSRLIVAGIVALTALGGCVNTGITPTSRDQVPQAVWNRVPPGTPVQNIQQGTVDGCYWYLRHGPLETVWVPVRDIESVPICT